MSSNIMHDDDDDDTASFYSVPEDSEYLHGPSSTGASEIPPKTLRVPDLPSLTTSSDSTSLSNSQKDCWSIPQISDIKERKAYPSYEEPSDVGQFETEMEMSDEEVTTLIAKALEEKELGNIHFRNAQYDEAIGRYQNALDICPIRIKPDRAIFHANIAACHSIKQRWEEAIKSCTIAIELNPNYLQALRRRASANEKLDKSSSLSSALEDYKRVLQLDPSNKEAAKAIQTFPSRIQIRQEQEKEEMMGKLKELGNQFLGMFGLSTDNFQMKQDPATGQYSMNLQK